MFCDRLLGEKDQETFISLISEKLGTHFDLTYHNLCPNKIPPIFGGYNYICITIIIRYILCFFDVLFCMNWREWYVLVSRDVVWSLVALFGRLWYCLVWLQATSCVVTPHWSTKTSQSSLS